MSAQPPPDFPALPGIDVAAGLKRLLNKPALYEKVLRDFHQRFLTSAARIRTQLADGEVLNAAQEAHSLKGLAGAIAATELQTRAASLEQALRTGANAQLVQTAFEAELAKVLDGIAQAWPTA